MTDFNNLNSNGSHNRMQVGELSVVDDVNKNIYKNDGMNVQINCNYVDLAFTKCLSIIFTLIMA